MSEMVERVAQAIGAKVGDFIDAAGWLGPETHAMGLERARAAIASMREPTDAMALVDTDPEDSTRIWVKMIDEALK
jgi:hypothetical protein